MPKNIQLHDDVYNKLTSLMRPKESYSELIERLLTMSDTFADLYNIIGGQIAFRKGQQERHAKENSPD